jgi:hypothetical protein
MVLMITGSGIATGIGGGVWFSSGLRRPVRHGMLACGMVAYSKAARPALLVNVGARDRPPWFPHLHTRASSRMVQSNRKKKSRQSHEDGTGPAFFSWF